MQYARPQAYQTLLSRIASLLLKLCILFLQDIGENEAAELVRLYQPILAGCVPELLHNVDLSNQATVKDELQVNELVSVTKSVVAVCVFLSHAGSTVMHIRQSTFCGMHSDEVCDILTGSFQGQDGAN